MAKLSTTHLLASRRMVGLWAATCAVLLASDLAAQTNSLRPVKQTPPPAMVQRPAVVEAPTPALQKVAPASYTVERNTNVAVGTGAAPAYRGQPASYARSMPSASVNRQRASGIGSYVPAHERQALVRQTSYEPEGSVYEKLREPQMVKPVAMVEEIAAGPNFVSEQEVYYEGEGMPGEYSEGMMMDEGYGYGDCADCGFGYNGCCPRCLIPMPSFSNLEAFAGVQGFTGPMNRGSNGSFGFSEGLNWGAAMPLGLAGQLGMRATQSNLDGSLITPDDRTQMFVTGGFFRRVDLGLQGGVVFDYMHQDWDYPLNLNQLRGELSWKFNCGHELGFWFAARGNRDTQNVSFPVVPTTQSNAGTVASVRYLSQATTMEATNIYAFFYRKQWANCGEGRAFGGFTDDNRGLLGMDGYVPLSGRLGLSANFLYMIPSDKSNRQFMDESWNVSINLVWSRQGSSRGNSNYCRPLFDVANNGNFIINGRQ